METFRTLVITLLCLLLISCENETPEPAGTDQMDLITKKWRYSTIKINGKQIWNNRVNNVLEVVDGPAIRNEIKRRKIEYHPTGYYILDWIRRGEYELGTFGDDNWQPSTGSFVIENDSLIHNPGTEWEKSYYILALSENVFIRISNRYMSREDPDYDNNGKNWEAGEEVQFQETFITDY